MLKGLLPPRDGDLGRAPGLNAGGVKPPELPAFAAPCLGVEPGLRPALLGAVGGLDVTIVGVVADPMEIFLVVVVVGLVS